MIPTLQLGGLGRAMGAAPSLLDQVIALVFASGGAVYAPSPMTCWQDTAGTTPAGVGDPVGRCDDLSGNGIHWLQATAGARPLLAQVSGFYRLETDGVDDILQSATSSFTLQEDISIYTACAFAVGANSGSLGAVAVGTGITNYFFAGHRQSNGSAYAFSRYANGGVAPANAQYSGAFAPPAPAVLRAELTAAGNLIQANNNTPATQASAGTVGPDATSWIALGRLPTTPHSYPCYNYGTVVADAIFASGDAAIVKAWLASISGVTL